MQYSALIMMMTMTMTMTNDDVDPTWTHTDDLNVIISMIADEVHSLMVILLLWLILAGSLLYISKPWWFGCYYICMFTS